MCVAGIGMMFGVEEGDGRLVLLIDGGVESIFDDAVDYFVVVPHHDVVFMACFDDSTVIIVEEADVSCIIDDVVVGGWHLGWVGLRRA